MNAFQTKIENFIREKQEKKRETVSVADWLDSASKRANQISLATHVIKFAYSKAKGTNIYVKGSQSLDFQKQPYVSTDSLLEKKNDFTCTAELCPVVSLLNIEVEGITLLKLITNDDSTPFACFTDSNERLLSWMNGFKALLCNKNLSSHTLSKQVYFPVDKDNYHLLSPLYPSSLLQALHDKIVESRYSDNAKNLRSCKINNLYSDGTLINFPDLACQKFQESKPQNISFLNLQRGGKSYLMRSTPPIWKKVKKLPMKKMAFWKEYDNRVYPLLKDFQAFLLDIKDRKANINLKQRSLKYLDQLLDFFLQVSSEIQSMEPGWSLSSEIALYEQIWLDPLREDLQDVRNAKDWMEKLSSCFASWIFNKLEYKTLLKFTGRNYYYLKKQCLTVLKEFSR